jgi:hypothetical protein
LDASSTVIAPARPHAFDENRVPGPESFHPKLQTEPPDWMVSLGIEAERRLSKPGLTGLTFAQKKQKKGEGVWLLSRRFICLPAIEPDGLDTIWSAESAIWDE